MSEQGENQGRDLERLRTYLHTLAQVQTDPYLRTHIDLSGVVQETLTEAWQEWEKLRACDEEHRIKRLRRMLVNNLRDKIDAVRAQCRDVARQQSLDAAAEGSSARVEAGLACAQSSPSEQAILHEDELRLAEALARLPDRNRTAVVLQYWHQWTLAQIAEHMGCTPRAVAGLLHRGLEKLQAHLRAPE